MTNNQIMAIRQRTVDMLQLLHVGTMNALNIGHFTSDPENGWRWDGKCESELSCDDPRMRAAWVFEQALAEYLNLFGHAVDIGQEQPA